MSGHLSSDQIEALAEGRASEESRAHAQACPECAGAAEGLGRFLAEIRSLRRLQAPPGFAARLRRRVDKETASGWKALWRAAFLPLKIKVPLQLAGAGMATLLLFWALPRWQASSPSPTPEYVRAPAPSEEEIAIEPPRPPVPEELASEKDEARSPMEAKAKARQAAPAELAAPPAPEPLAQAPVASSPPAEGEGAARFSAERSPAPAAKPAAPASVPETPPKKQAAPEPKTEKKAVEAPANDLLSGMWPQSEDRALSPEPELPSAEQAAAPASAAEPAPVAAPPAADNVEVTPEQETALRALGFKAQLRGASKKMALRIPAAEWDSLRTRLRDLGLEGRAVYLPSPPDSADVEVR